LSSDPSPCARAHHGQMSSRGRQGSRREQH
jgi:hypothetical protein